MARPALGGGVRALYTTVVKTLEEQYTALGAWQRRLQRDGHQSFESLEHRRLLAGQGLSSGTLWVDGNGSSSNTIDVKLSSSNVVVTLNGSSRGYSLSSVKKLEIAGGSKNDYIVVDSSLKLGATQISGWEGHDTIIGSGGNDVIFGGSGDDIIDGRAGNDTIYGQDGDDIIYGGSGSDDLWGQGGSDRINHDGSYTSSGIKLAESTSTATTTSTTSTTGPTVNSFTVYNAVTDTAVMTLTEGSVIDFAKIGTNKINIVANVSSGTESVRFGWDSNSSYRTESSAPYAIGGDFGSGDYAAWTPATGTHTIKGTAYTKDGASGTAGPTKSVTFTVTSGSTSSGGDTSGGGSTPSESTDSSSPTAVITAVSSRSIMAGQAVHFHAMSSTLGTGTPLTTRYVWNFGDSDGKYNTLEGYNAAHFFQNAGTYTVKLTVTNAAGKSHTTSTTVNVASNTRKKIYVSAAGSDSNSGTSSSSPIRTFAKAASLAGSNTEILFRRGDTFDVYDRMNLHGTNIVVGAYGSGERPVLKWRGGLDYGTVIYTGDTANTITVRDLTFDSPYSDDSAMPRAVRTSGLNTTVLNNQFLNLGYAIHNGNMPRGVLAQDNVAPLKLGVRNYFVYGGGDDQVYLGNTVANTLEHVLRLESADRALIAYNNFSNPVEDGTIRGTLTIHSGTYVYVAKNTLTDGKVTIGPMSGDPGLPIKDARWRWGVFDGNRIDSKMVIQHGAERLMLRNNVIRDDGGHAIVIEGYNDEFDRGVVDVTIANNTVLNSATYGNFLHVSGKTTGISLVNNLYLAPNLVTGSYQSAPVMVRYPDLSGFTKITNNVWGMPYIKSYAEGGINYVYSSWPASAGYRTPSEWNAFSQVGTDYFVDTSYSGFTPSSSSFTADAGTKFAGVFTDYNGTLRPSSGSWSAGAVEV